MYTCNIAFSSSSMYCLTIFRTPFRPIIVGRDKYTSFLFPCLQPFDETKAFEIKNNKNVFYQYICT